MDKKAKHLTGLRVSWLGDSAGSSLPVIPSLAVEGAFSFLAGTNIPDADLVPIDPWAQEVPGKMCLSDS